MIKVLVTNDDGIDVRGLTVLVDALSKYADVYVAAPKVQQSGKSHAITFMREVSAEKRDVKGAVEAYVVDGTPADCVKWAAGRLREEGVALDYVFSGINLGYNAGIAAYYSGTVAGAREAAINGIRSIALSVGNAEATKFDYILGLLPRLMDMSSRLTPSTILNVNAPDIESWEIRGVRVAETAPAGYGIRFVFANTEGNHYQMKGEPDHRDDRMRYDIDWNDAGYVSVSPIPTSFEDPVALMKLKGQIAVSDHLAVIVDAQETVAEGLKKPNKFRRNISKFARCISRMGAPLLICETFGGGATFEEIEEAAGEAERVVHMQPDAWSAPDMQKHTGSVTARKVLIAGAATNAALLQTALGFVERGYDVTVLEDCCAASKKKEHRFAVDELRAAGCSISSCETAVMKVSADCERVIRDSVTKILEAD